MYIPPKARASSYHAVLKCVRDTILNIKKTADNPIIIIRGDLNRYNFGEVTNCFQDIEIHNIGHTRGRAELEKLATNLSHIRTTIRQPLSNEAGTKQSEHAVVLASTLIKNKKD